MPRRCLIPPCEAGRVAAIAAGWGALRLDGSPHYLRSRPHPTRHQHVYARHCRANGSTSPFRGGMAPNPPRFFPSRRGYPFSEYALKRSRPRLPERWQSGRSHRTRNAAYGQPYRGFESLPLRHFWTNAGRAAGRFLPQSVVPLPATGITPLVRVALPARSAPAREGCSSPPTDRCAAARSAKNRGCCRTRARV